MQFLKQTWALTRKDLLIIAWRRWLSTLIRALILPIVFTVLLSEIRNWTKTPGQWGVGSPSPIRSLQDTLASTGSSRPKVVIIDNGFKDGDIGDVVANLSSIVRNSGKELHVLDNDSTLKSVCPSSNGGVSDCFGAVQFYASPDHGGKNWNYTLYADSSLGENIDVTNNNNDLQVYQLPLQRAIDSAIATTHGGSGLEDVMQYPFTRLSEADKEAEDREEFQDTFGFALAFAFFIGLSGLTYHCVGYICHQRENGLLELVDAMMPNKRRWECIAARILSTHLAFDIIYLPGWIVMGAVLPVVDLPHTNAGYIILLYILTGLAMTSYSILASSLFRKAQISGSAAIIAALAFAIVAQFAEGNIETATSAGVYATAVLFPPSTYVYVLIQASGYEIRQQGLDLDQSAPFIEYWSIPASAFLGLFVFQIIVYPILGGFVEHYLHGTSSRSRTISNSETMGGAAVKLRNFSKHFKSRVDKKQTVKAVDDLTLDLHTGSITVLLGANGSGKSTTLNSIAGNETITSGTIEIDGTGGLGICPQKNIMWDFMTVREHIDFFERVKNPGARSKSERKAEVDRIIHGCDLEVKESALSKTLSGGQKRKLQLAMMLAGGSRVCCIDEASSGIDPIARRKVWEILLAEKGQRSLLFTTHFLDEAEGLSDHVAILSKGVLKAQGSVATLKNELGGGYQVVVSGGLRGVEVPMPQGVTQHKDYNHTVFSIPDTSVLAGFITMLEQKGIQDYRVEGPTIEKVFLKLAEEMQGDSDLARELRLAEASDNEGSEITMSPTVKHRALDLDTGRGVGPIKQTGIIFLKRLIILRHNYMPYIAALFVSLVVSGLVTRFLLGDDNLYPNGIPCANPDGSSFYRPYVYHPSPYSFSGSNFVWGPPDRLPAGTLQAAIPNTTRSSNYYYYPGTMSNNVTSSPQVSSLDQFNSFVKANSSRLQDGGLFDGANNPLFAWQFAEYSGNTAAMGLHSVLNGIAMNKTIEFGYTSFQSSFSPANGVGSLVVVFTTLGFAIYPGFFALYPTAERIRNVRAMHYSNGIMSSSLWAAHALFDFCFIVLISVLTIAIWLSEWNGWYAPGYMFVCFFLYGLSATAFSYVVSLFVSSQLSAFAFTSVIQVIISMLYYVGYIVSTANAPANMVYTWFNYIHYTVGLISPAANLERALFMTLNQWSLVCHGNSKASYPGEIGIYGAPILYMLIQFLVLSAFLMFWESGRSLEVFGIRRKRSAKAVQKDTEKAAQLHAQGPDATEDASRLSDENHGLRVENISKSFGSTHAVENVTFGIMPSEKFALLGPNGAGKSTMISLIRGDLRPSHSKEGSSIHIGGDSLYYAPVAAKNHLGVCPQFDSIDSMTLLEHLRFYARARGVTNREANIQELIRRLGLTEHKNKMAKKLSGGTKRKLSLAIALISNPSVLLLDEPSSGMDPAAKRALWSTLSAIAQGRVLLMTTHSMEEADALCDRAGIIAGRLLALGSIDQLRARHGNAAFVHLVHKDAPYTADADMAAMRAWVEETFPDARVEQRNFGGQMRFSVPKAVAAGGGSDGVAAKDDNTGALFRRIEAVKQDIGVVDYSVGPATLDQVFLNVVGRHDVQEENTEKKTKKTGMSWLKNIFK